MDRSKRVPVKLSVPPFALTPKSITPACEMEVAATVASKAVAKAVTTIFMYPPKEEYG